MGNASDSGESSGSSSPPLSHESSPEHSLLCGNLWEQVARTLDVHGWCRLTQTSSWLWQLLHKHPQRSEIQILSHILALASRERTNSGINTSAGVAWCPRSGYSDVSTHCPDLKSNSKSQLRCLVCGLSGAGKSTVIHNLMRRPHSYAVPVHPSIEQVSVGGCQLCCTEFCRIPTIDLQLQLLHMVPQDFLVFVVNSSTGNDSSLLGEAQELLEASLASISRRAPVVILCNTIDGQHTRPSCLLAALQRGSHWSRRSWCVKGCSAHGYIDSRGVGANTGVNGVHDAVAWGVQQLSLMDE